MAGNPKRDGIIPRTNVCEYLGGRDQEIAGLVLSIQNDEAGLNIGIEEQSDLLDIGRAYGSGGFWIAVNCCDSIVGSIGLIAFGRTGVLKRFFVTNSYRGNGGPAPTLFHVLLAKARVVGLSDIMLDTPAVATRSHAFYERNGFERAEVHDLPAAYAYPDRNSILYRLVLVPQL